MPSALRARVGHAATRSLLISAIAAGTVGLATPAHAAPKPVDHTLGMPAPSSPESATSDDAMVAWVLKHGTEADRRAMATDMGAHYPSDATILGATCDKGQGYVGVWVINFAATKVRWNVTVDGAGYAGASVLPRSHDYGAIGVPDGKHTVAFVDPATGRVAASLRTSLSCASKAPVVTKPSRPVVTKPSRPVVTKPSQPVVTPPTRPTKPVSATPVPAKHNPTKPVPAKPVPSKSSSSVSAHAHGRPAPVNHAAPSAGPMGPKVQADSVATTGGSNPSSGLVAGLLGAVVGALVLARRLMRG